MPKTPQKINLKSLEPLIQELTKDNPSSTKVKKMMLDQGLPFSADPIQQLSTVLTLINETPTKKNKDRGIGL